MLEGFIPGERSYCIGVALGRVDFNLASRHFATVPAAEELRLRGSIRDLAGAAGAAPAMPCETHFFVSAFPAAT